MGLSRAELDKRIEETKRQRAAKSTTPKRSGWERAKEAVGKAAKAYKESAGKPGKHGKRSMMESLERFSSYDPFGSPRSRSRKRSKPKKAKRSAGRTPYKTVTYYR